MCGTRGCRVCDRAGGRECGGREQNCWKPDWVAALPMGLGESEGVLELASAVGEGVLD